MSRQPRLQTYIARHIQSETPANAGKKRNYQMRLTCDYYSTKNHSLMAHLPQLEPTCPKKSSNQVITIKTNRGKLPSFICVVNFDVSVFFPVYFLYRLHITLVHLYPRGNLYSSFSKTGIY